MLSRHMLSKQHEHMSGYIRTRLLLLYFSRGRIPSCQLYFQVQLTGVTHSLHPH